jgi:hypothetical protein
VQPGIKQTGKDGQRRTVKGQITVKATSVPMPLNMRLDLRYRLVGTTLPDTFASPADDPPVPSDTIWQTTALAKSIFTVAEDGAAGFITTLDTDILESAKWYEIIAVANYNPDAGFYDSWNADNKNKRVFIYIEPSEPEIEETANRQKTLVPKDRANEINKKGEVTISIPYQGVSTDTALTVARPTSLPSSGGLCFIDAYQEITLSNGTILIKPARVSLSYPDADNNGIVDGTTIPEATLIIYRYDEVDGKWEPLPNQIIEPDNNIISGLAPDFSIFGIAGTPVPGGEILTGSSGMGSTSNWRCFVATAAYGTPLAQEVCILREFRDRYLITHLPGNIFVQAYYRLSPPLAQIIARSEILRTVTRIILKPVIWLATFMVTTKSVVKWLVLCLWLIILGLIVLRLTYSRRLISYR